MCAVLIIIIIIIIIIIWNSDWEIKRDGNAALGFFYISCSCSKTGLYW